MKYLPLSLTNYAFVLFCFFFIFSVCIYLSLNSLDFFASTLPLFTHKAIRHGAEKRVHRENAMQLSHLPLLLTLPLTP